MSCARIRAETVSTHHQQVAGATGFPPQMAMAAAIDREDPKDVAILRKALQAIADEAMDPGINMPLIPVLDVNQNPDNPIICTRAFSDSPETVAWFGSEYVRALEGAGLIMRITWIDWIIIIAYMLMSLVLGLYFSKKASSNTEEFFLSGRNLPWWLVGTSMVATTFSSDTPLYVTGLVRSQGIYENWQWWCFVISGMLS
ncbi:MAG TPA: hypothetical protein ENI58_08145, partial [Nitrospirae bacterium]|nr:hypothetical protein [Nitrospirota bacterium]